MKRVLLAMAAALALIAPATANAAVITYGTPSGSQVGGLDVAASATITTSNGGVTVLLSNTIVDPESVIQNISGISFTITGATSGSLTSSTGTPRTINADGTYSDGAATTTDWFLTFGAGNFSLSGLGGGGPDETIVGLPNAGTNEYDNANGSLAGNGPHNPFLFTSGTFVISGAGITDQSVVSNVIFYFGTAPTAFTPVCTSGCGDPFPRTTPEPTSMVLLGTGLLAVATRLRRKKA